MSGFWCESNSTCFKLNIVKTTANFFDRSIRDTPRPAPDPGKVAACAGCCGPVRDSFSAVFGPRRHGRRRLLAVFLGSFMALVLCLNTGDFDYLMTRLKFSWTAAR